MDGVTPKTAQEALECLRLISFPLQRSSSREDNFKRRLLKERTHGCEGISRLDD